MSGPASAMLLRGVGLGLGLGAASAVVFGDFGSGLPLVLSAGAVIAVAVSSIVGRRAIDPRSSIADEAASGWSEFRRELARARRHERPLSVVRLVDAGTGGSVALTTGPRRPLRRVDRAWSDGADLVILMPESDRAAAERAIGRLARALDLDPAAARIATFPADGLTSTALVAAIGDRAGAPTPASLAAAAPERPGATSGRAAHG